MEEGVMSVASPSAVYAERSGSADLPGGAPRTLADEHALLLGQVAAAAGEQLLSPGGLAAATRDFVGQLEHHMRAEEETLAAQRAPDGVPATVALGSHPHRWYPLTEGPVIDLDALPPGQAVAAAVDRLLRVRRGE